MRVARALEELGATLVGGQAVNFWAEVFFSAVPELASFGPFTSRDVDFFGSADVAKKLATVLGGKAMLPTMDDHTPNTALVVADVDGCRVQIDFLDNILGIPHGKVESTQIRVTLTTADEKTESFRLKILHPVDCLISRVNSFLHPAIQRSDAFVVNQINACVLVLKQYIGDLLSENQTKEVHWCFRTLHDFLHRDGYGRVAHVGTPVDPLDILRHFRGDERLDVRYREITLKKMIARIEQRRGVLLAKQAALIDVAAPAGTVCGIIKPPPLKH